MYCMIFKSKKHYNLDKKLQDFINYYKITVALHNFPTFHSPTDEKKVLLYFQTIKRLQDAYIINYH